MPKMETTVVGAIMLLLIQSQTIGVASRTTIVERPAYPVEIAIVIDVSASYWQIVFTHIVFAVRALPDYVEMGEQKARVAVVIYGYKSGVAFRLTSDEEPVRSLKFAGFGGTQSDAHKALDDVKNKVFTEARPEAEKVVIFLNDGNPTDRKLTEEAAEELRRGGAVIYPVFVPPTVNDAIMSPDASAHLEKVAGDPSKVYKFKNYFNFTPEVFRRIIYGVIREKERCEFAEACGFIDARRGDGHCIPQLYRPKAGDEPCWNEEPAPKLTCHNESVCYESCDRLWPWSPRLCTLRDAGKNLTWTRNGPMPLEHKVIIQLCPTEKIVTCNATETTPSTIPTTFTTVPSTTTTVPTTTTTVPTTTTTVPTTTTTVPTTTTAVPTSVRIVPTGTSTVLTSSKSKSSTHHGRQEGVSEIIPSSKKAGFPIWIIILICLIALILIFVIISVLVVMERRKRRRKTVMLKEKEAASMKKKAAPVPVDLPRKKSMHGEELALSHGYGRGAAEESVSASMMDHETGKAPSGQKKQQSKLQEPGQKKQQSKVQEPGQKKQQSKVQEPGQKKQQSKVQEPGQKKQQPKLQKPSPTKPK